MKLHLCIFLWLLFTTVVFSQKKATFSVKYNDTPLSKVLLDIETVYAVRFSYHDDLINNKKITLIKSYGNFQEIILKLETIFNIRFQKINKKNYIILKHKGTLADIQMLDNVLISNYLNSGIYKKKNGSFKIDIERLAILPGLIEADVIESIQQLPGVISPNETATGLIVRGGSNDQNRIIWDGINSYHNGHLFGMISSFNPNMANKVTFYNKGTNPRFGERISSVIDIETDNSIREKLFASVDFNGINTSAMLAIPIVNKKLSVQLALRRSYAELFESITFNKLANKVFQNTKIQNAQNTNNAFSFIDYNAKFNFNANKNNQFYISFFNIDNNLDYVVNDVENEKSFNDVLNIKNEGYSLRWNKNWSKKVKQTTLGSFSNYKFNYNFIKKIETKKISDFDKRNTIYDTSIFTEFNINTKNNDNVSLGYQYNFKDVSYAFLETGEVSLILDSNQTEASVHSFFTNYSYHNDKLFDFEFGFRVNYFAEINKTRLEPRFIFYKDLFKNIKMQFTGEVKNQVISQIDETILSDLSLENRIWRLADGQSYPIISSNQFSIGFIYKNNGWSLDLDFYKKFTSGLSSLSLGFLNPLDNSVHLGNQKINGIDFYIKKDYKKIKTWINYSYSDVKNRFDNINEKQYFTANNAIAHAATVSVAYKLKQFEMALGFKVHSGKPFTKGILQEDSTRDFNEINTEKLDIYHRLDFSSTYQFSFDKTKKLKGKVGLSIRNIYNQNNQISREYTGNNSINDPIRVVDKYSLGFTPNFLFKIYW